jgi:hypothetical protein
MMVNARSFLDECSAVFMLALRFKAGLVGVGELSCRSAPIMRIAQSLVECTGEDEE